MKNLEQVQKLKNYIIFDNKELKEAIDLKKFFPTFAFKQNSNINIFDNILYDNESDIFFLKGYKEFLIFNYNALQQMALNTNEQALKNFNIVKLDQEIVYWSIFDKNIIIVLVQELFLFSINDVTSIFGINKKNIKMESAALITKIQRFSNDSFLALLSNQELVQLNFSNQQHEKLIQCEEFVINQKDKQIYIFSDNMMQSFNINDKTLKNIDKSLNIQQKVYFMEIMNDNIFYVTQENEEIYKLYTINLQNQFEQKEQTEFVLDEYLPYDYKNFNIQFKITEQNNFAIITNNFQSQFQLGYFLSENNYKKFIILDIECDKIPETEIYINEGKNYPTLIAGLVLFQKTLLNKDEKNTQKISQIFKNENDEYISINYPPRIILLDNYSRILFRNFEIYDQSQQFQQLQEPKNETINTKFCLKPVQNAFLEIKSNNNTSNLLNNLIQTKTNQDFLGFNISKSIQNQNHQQDNDDKQSQPKQEKVKEIQNIFQQQQQQHQKYKASNDNQVLKQKDNPIKTKSHIGQNIDSLNKYDPVPIFQQIINQQNQPQSDMEEHLIKNLQNLVFFRQDNRKRTFQNIGANVEIQKMTLIQQNKQIKDKPNKIKLNSNFLMKLFNTLKEDTILQKSKSPKPQILNEDIQELKQSIKQIDIYNNLFANGNKQTKSKNTHQNTQLNAVISDFQNKITNQKRLLKQQTNIYKQITNVSKEEEHYLYEPKLNKSYQQLLPNGLFSQDKNKSFQLDFSSIMQIDILKQQLKKLNGKANNIYDIVQKIIDNNKQENSLAQTSVFDLQEQENEVMYSLQNEQTFLSNISQNSISLQQMLQQQIKNHIEYKVDFKVTPQIKKSDILLNDNILSNMNNMLQKTKQWNIQDDDLKKTDDEENQKNQSKITSNITKNIIEPKINITDKQNLLNNINLNKINDDKKEGTELKDKVTPQKQKDISQNIFNLNKDQKTFPFNIKQQNDSENAKLNDKNLFEVDKANVNNLFDSNKQPKVIAQIGKNTSEAQKKENIKNNFLESYQDDNKQAQNLQSNQQNDMYNKQINDQDNIQCLKQNTNQQQTNIFFNKKENTEKQSKENIDTKANFFTNIEKKQGDMKIPFLTQKKDISNEENTTNTQNGFLISKQNQQQLTKKDNTEQNKVKYPAMENIKNLASPNQNQKDDIISEIEKQTQKENQPIEKTPSEQKNKPSDQIETKNLFDTNSKQKICFNNQASNINNKFQFNDITKSFQQTNPMNNFTQNQKEIDENNKSESNLQQQQQQLLSDINTTEQSKTNTNLNLNKQEAPVFGQSSFFNVNKNQQTLNAQPTIQQPFNFTHQDNTQQTFKFGQSHINTTQTQQMPSKNVSSFTFNSNVQQSNFPSLGSQANNTNLFGQGNQLSGFFSQGNNTLKNEGGQQQQTYQNVPPLFNPNEIRKPNNM